MRILLTAALLSATLAAPAMAQSRDQAEKTVRALQNPMVQEGLASVLTNLAGIVLDTDIGPLARYDETVRPDDTLRAYQRRNDPGFEARLHNGTKRAVATAGTTAGDALAMGAAIDDTTARLRAALEPLARALDSHSDN